jgi:hypothetical protein
LSKEFIQAAVEDGASYTLVLSNEASLAAINEAGFSAAAVEGAGVGYEANKPVNAKLGLSTPAEKDTGGVAVSQDGKETPIKYNPATKAQEWTVDGATAKASYSRKIFSVNFSDVASLSQSSRNAIIYLAERGVIKGMSETAFGPKDSITRAQLTQLVVSAINKLDSSADGNFTDVGKSDWMRAGVGSGKRIGIISGNPDGTFLPNSTITKEQIIAISARTLIMEMPKLKSISSQDAILSAFKDGSSIPEWAKNDVAIAKRADLFAISTSGRFNPGSNMTRADAAFIIKRLFDRLWL